MRRLLILLFALPLFARAEDTGPDAVCRAHLKRLGAAVRAYRLIHEDKNPGKLSDLYLEGLVESFGDFACPASGVTIAAASEIDAKTDYTLEPVPDVKDVIVHEKTARHDSGSILAVFADGTIKPIAG